MKIYKQVAYILATGIMWIGLISFTTKTVAKECEPLPTEQTIEIPEPEEASGSSRTDNVPVKASTPVPSQKVQVTVEPTPSPTPEPTPTPTPTPLPNDLVCEGNSELHSLVQNYLNAELACDMSALSELVTDPSHIDLDYLQRRTEAITEYSNLTVYHKRGIGDIDYAVYYTYSMHIISIDTPALGIDVVYVRIGDDGKPRVFFGELDDDTEAYLTSLNSDPDVLELINRTYEEMGKAAAADDDLLAFWQRLYALDEEP